MKKLLFLSFAIFPVFSFAEGPLFSHKDTVVQQEFENAYKDIRNKGLNGGTSGYVLVGTGSDNKPGYNFNLLGNTSGQMLIGQGAAAMPIWTTFGRILSYSTATFTTSTTTTSTSFIWTGLGKQFPRVSTTSFILLYASMAHMQNLTSGSSAQATFMRDGFNLAPDADGLCEARSATAPDRFPCSMVMIDRPPNSSQSINYTVQFKTDGAGTAQIDTGSAQSMYMLILEISN